MIKVILFDYGGVLSPDGKVGTIAELFKEIGDVSGRTIDPQAYISRLLRGDMSGEAFLAEVCGDDAEASDAIRDLFTKHILSRNEALYDFAKAVRHAGIKTGIFSNVICFTADGLKARGHYDGFDPVILSCEQGISKPQPGMYARAVTISGVSPEEILFVDDQPQNLVPAEALGMYTLLAVTVGQAIRDIKALLLLENNLDLTDTVHA